MSDTSYESDGDPGSQPSGGSPWSWINLANPDYGDDPYTGGLPSGSDPNQQSADPLAQRLGQVMLAIVSDPYGTRDSDPNTDPWVPSFRGPPLMSPVPGLLGPAPGSGPSSGIYLPQVQGLYGSGSVGSYVDGSESGTNGWWNGPTGDSQSQSPADGDQNASWQNAFGFQGNPGLDFGLATDGDGQFIDIGGKVQAQRRQWELQNGQDWPKNADGRNYDAHHVVPKADGGSDTVDNIRPMHPDEHRAEHMANGDFIRWAKRAGIAKAFRGLPLEEPPISGLGIFQLIPDITGIFSGRIRTDSFNNFVSDMIGVPSQEDIQKRQQDIQKQLFPNAKPGEIWL